MKVHEDMCHHTVMKQLSTMYVMVHWVKKTTIGSGVLLSRMVYIYRASDYLVCFPWLDIPPQYSVFCIWLKYFPGSEDTIGLALSHVMLIQMSSESNKSMMSSESNKCIIIKFRIIDLTVRNQDCFSVQLRSQSSTVFWWQVIYGGNISDRFWYCFVIFSLNAYLPQGLRML